ncbi:MAG: hypothetical protein P4N59_06560 [Negativicutes bacterium]|nr:hypothetical protein [Negativicutes bacterium]
MLTAVKYLGRMRVGITTPRLFRADDRKVYVVKLQNNLLGPRVLASELLATKLGEMMGLRFPPGGIITIGEQLLKESRSLQEAGGSPGRHFASLFLNHAEYVDRGNMGKAVNSAEMAGILLFDHMFHNADRSTNGKNLLLRREEKGPMMYAIDNSHLFKSGRWTAESLRRLGNVITPYYRYSYGRLLKNHLSPEDFRPYMAKMAGISDAQVADLVREIPWEWLPDEEVRAELSRFIGMRRDRMEGIWEELCKHIPIARGGRQWWGGEKSDPGEEKKRKWLGKY